MHFVYIFPILHNPPNFLEPLYNVFFCLLELDEMLSVVTLNYLQEKIKSALSLLQEKKDSFEKMRGNYEDTVEHIQVTFLYF